VHRRAGLTTAAEGPHGYIRHDGAQGYEADAEAVEDATSAGVTMTHAAPCQHGDARRRVGEEVADPTEGRPDPAASSLAGRGGRASNHRCPRARRHRELREERLGAEGGGGGVPADKRGHAAAEGPWEGAAAAKSGEEGRAGCHRLASPSEYLHIDPFNWFQEIDLRA
jgi:hypothetical protein